MVHLKMEFCSSRGRKQCCKLHYCLLRVFRDSHFLICSVFFVYKGIFDVYFMINTDVTRDLCFLVFFVFVFFFCVCFFICFFVVVVFFVVLFVFFFVFFFFFFFFFFFLWRWFSYLHNVNEG